MIALDGALRRLIVCQLTRESRGNGGGLRPRVWLRLRAAAWGQLDPGWNLTIGRRSQFLIVLGNMKRTDPDPGGRWGRANPMNGDDLGDMMQE